jgi:hypothetical protein
MDSMHVDGDLSQREEHYDNTWRNSDGYVFLGSFLKEMWADGDDTYYGQREGKIVDMYCMAGYKSAWNSVSICVRWGNDFTDTEVGNATLDADGYWDVVGSSDIHYAALQYFANHHQAIAGNNSILQEGMVKLPKETVQ